MSRASPPGTQSDDVDAEGVDGVGVVGVLGVGLSVEELLGV
jgi:hypothetical protein